MKATDAIIKNENLFQRLVESLPQRIFIKDINSVYITCNEIYARDLGIYKEDIIGKDDFAFHPKELANKYRMDDREVITTGKTKISEEQYLSQGKTYWINTTKIPFCDNDGKIIGVLGIFEDITERKNAEEELRLYKGNLEKLVEERTNALRNEINRTIETKKALSESENRYRNIVDHTSSIVLEWDTDGNIVFMNKYGLELFGFEPEEILGHNVLGTIVETKDTTGYNLEEKMLDVQTHPEEYYSSENENIRKNGDKIWIAWTNKGIYNSDGQLVKTISVGIDRSRQREMEIELMKYHNSLQKMVDISTRELTATNDRLNKSQTLLKSIIDSTNDLIWSVNSNDFGLLNWNLSFQEYFLQGRGIKITIGLRPDDLFPPQSEFGRFWIHIYEQTLKTGSISKEYITFNKSMTLLINSGLLVEDGNVFGISIFAKDITERKLSEEAIKISEDHFRSIINNFQDAFFQVDLSGIFTLVSPSAVKMYRYNSLEDMTEMPATSIYLNSAERNKLLTELDKKGSVKDYICQAKRKDGTIFWASMNVQYKFEDGTISGTEGVVRDITERVINQDKIRTLSSAIEQSPIMVIITDTNGDIEYLNPKFTQITGYKLEDVLGKNPRFLKSGYTSPDEYKNLWETIKSGNVWSGEFCNVKKDGGSYHESASISPIIDENGKIIHFIGVKEDITEKRQMIKDLITSKEKAEESDRLKSAFLANMSHEIRTPMNGILGFSELLKESGLSDNDRLEYVDIIQKSGTRLLKIINEIMDISKIEAGLMDVNIHKINLNSYIAYLMKFFKPEAEAKQLKLSFECGLDDDEAFINTDGEKLYAVLANLINNSIKYTNQGSIEFGYKKGSDYKIEFFVKDTGIGIPVHHQQAVFQRFMQSDTTDIKARQGAGLGLSIAKAYVVMLGGQIWVESKFGAGSVFYFTLPLN